MKNHKSDIGHWITFFAGATCIFSQNWGFTTKKGAQIGLKIAKNGKFLLREVKITSAIIILG